jgi:pentalenolactone synthase
VISQLVPRFPEMRLAVGIDGLRFKTDVLTGGLLELPVTW